MSELVKKRRYRIRRKREELLFLFVVSSLLGMFGLIIGLPIGWMIQIEYLWFVGWIVVTLLIFFSLVHAFREPKKESENNVVHLNEFKRE